MTAFLNPDKAPFRKRSDKSFPAPLLVLMKIHSFLLSSSCQHLTFLFALSNLPRLLFQAGSPLPLAAIPCEGPHRSLLQPPSTPEKPVSPSAATSWCAVTVTRWTNARHTCLLITTYFQFSNCQAQYSGTSFPGSGIAELTQNRLPDIYHTAHSAGHIYHVPALLIHLGERYTVVSAVWQRFQTSSGRRSGRVCLISRFMHFLLHSGPNFFFSSNCSINQILSLYLPQELMYWSGLNPLERNWLPLFFFSPLLSLRTLLNQTRVFLFFFNGR